jgi:hypothetical protein
MNLPALAAEPRRDPQLPATPANPNQPVDLGDGLTPADVWQSLHASERRWMAQGAPDQRLAFGQFVDASDRQVMASLQSFPAARWTSLCDGAGWTPIACAALSWCEGATLDAVLGMWRVLGAWPQPGNAAERAAGFLNPALLPESRFMALLEKGKDGIGTAVLIAARAEAPALDIPGDRLPQLNPALAVLIEARQARS